MATLGKIPIMEQWPSYSRQVIQWSRSHRELLIYLLLMALALSLRLWDLGSRALHHDESLHAIYSWYVNIGNGYRHDPLMHGPFQFFGTSTIFALFGDSNVTARLLPALFGTILVGLPYLLRNLLGRPGALIVAAILALSPTMLYFSRFARNDIYMAVWALSLVIVTWRYLQEGKTRYLYISAALLALALATKETAFILVALLGGYFFILAVGKLFIPQERRHPQHNRAGNLLILFITLTLPLWSAGIALFQDQIGVVLANPDPGAGPVGVPLGVGLGVAAIVVALLLIISVVMGLVWNYRLWLVSAAIFSGIWVLLYTSFLTNFFDGLGSGLWRSLGYWVAQQEVARGNQPWYYYFVVGLNYEFLPFTFAVLGGFFYLFKGNAFSRFLVYWSVTGFIAYTLAGEKMPWLSVNVVLPLILLGGKFLGYLVGRVPWRKGVTREGVLMLALVAGIVVFGVWSVLTVVRTTDFYQGVNFWILLIVTLLFIAVGGLLFRRLPRRQSLTLIALGLALVMVYPTVNSSLRASYRNGDVPYEMLVYTQSSPDIPRLVERMDLLAKERGVEKEALRIIVDGADGFAWPWAWYLRDFKNVSYPDLAKNPLTAPPDADVVLLNAGSRSANEPFLTEYTQVIDYKHRWWHPETYRNLSPSGIAQAITRRDGWNGILDYFLFRKLGTDLGAINAVAYFPPESPV